MNLKGFALLVILNNNFILEAFAALDEPVSVKSTAIPDISNIPKPESYPKALLDAIGIGLQSSYSNILRELVSVQKIKDLYDKIFRSGGLFDPENSEYKSLKDFINELNKIAASTAKIIKFIDEKNSKSDSGPFSVEPKINSRNGNYLIKFPSSFPHDESVEYAGIKNFRSWKDENDKIKHIPIGVSGFITINAERIKVEKKDSISYVCNKIDSLGVCNISLIRNDENSYFLKITAKNPFEKLEILFEEEKDLLKTLGIGDWVVDGQNFITKKVGEMNKNPEEPLGISTVLRIYKNDIKIEEGDSLNSISHKINAAGVNTKDVLNDSIDHLLYLLSLKDESWSQKVEDAAKAVKAASVDELKRQNKTSLKNFWQTGFWGWVGNLFVGDSDPLIDKQINFINKELEQICNSPSYSLSAILDQNCIKLIAPMRVLVREIALRPILPHLGIAMHPELAQRKKTIYHPNSRAIVSKTLPIGISGTIKLTQDKSIQIGIHDGLSSIANKINAKGTNIKATIKEHPISNFEVVVASVRDEKVTGYYIELESPDPISFDSPIFDSNDDGEASMFRSLKLYIEEGKEFNYSPAPASLDNVFFSADPNYIPKIPIGGTIVVYISGEGEKEISIPSHSSLDNVAGLINLAFGKGQGHEIVVKKTFPVAYFGRNPWMQQNVAGGVNCCLLNWKAPEGKKISIKHKETNGIKAIDPTPAARNVGSWIPIKFKYNSKEEMVAGVKLGLHSDNLKLTPISLNSLQLEDPRVGKITFSSKAGNVENEQAFEIISSAENPDTPANLEAVIQYIGNIGQLFKQDYQLLQTYPSFKNALEAFHKIGKCGDAMYAKVRANDLGLAVQRIGQEEAVTITTIVDSNKLKSEGNLSKVCTFFHGKTFSTFDKVEFIRPVYNYDWFVKNVTGDDLQADIRKLLLTDELGSYCFAEIEEKKEEEGKFMCKISNIVENNQTPEEVQNIFIKNLEGERLEEYAPILFSCSEVAFFYKGRCPNKIRIYMCPGFTHDVIWYAGNMKKTMDELKAEIEAKLDKEFKEIYGKFEKSMKEMQQMVGRGNEMVRQNKTNESTNRLMGGFVSDSFGRGY